MLYVSLSAVLSAGIGHPQKIAVAIAAIISHFIYFNHFSHLRGKTEPTNLGGGWFAEAWK